MKWSASSYQTAHLPIESKLLLGREELKAVFHLPYAVRYLAVSRKRDNHGETGMKDQ